MKQDMRRKRKKRYSALLAVLLSGVLAVPAGFPVYAGENEVLIIEGGTAEQPEPGADEIVIPERDRAASPEKMMVKDIREVFTEPIAETVMEAVTARNEETVAEAVMARNAETVAEAVMVSDVEPSTGASMDPGVEPPMEVLTEPIPETSTEPITESGAEPPTEPITEPGAEPPAETITEPGTEPPAETITEPGTEPPTEPITEPGAEPPTETIIEPGAEPPTEVLTEPSTETATEAPTEGSPETEQSGESSSGETDPEIINGEERENESGETSAPEEQTEETEPEEDFIEIVEDGMLGQVLLAAPASLEIVNNTLEISTEEELSEFRNSVAEGNDYSGITVKLMNDIDISTLTDGRDGWVPIGLYANRTPFSGTFDGCGYTISGMKDLPNGYSYMGLFGYLKGGTVCNLHVTGNITKGTENGGVVCVNEGGTVENCSFSGSVAGSLAGGIVEWNTGIVINCTNSGNVTGGQAGGIVGSNGGIVNNCVNSGSVTGTNYVGGVAGSNSSGTVTNCYNIGAVSGTNIIGGVVGYNWDSVTNCYNTGTVSGTDYIGGVAGYSFRTVTSCYNTGAVTGANAEYTGGIVGDIFISGTITNCYYLNTAADSGTSEAAARTAEEFASGEVANLLQNGQSGLVWGQTIGSDQYPVLTGEQSRQVYKVSFDYTAEDTADVVRYANYGGTAALPDGSGFTASTGNITLWQTEEGGTFTASTQVTADIVLTERGIFFAEGSGTQSDPYRIPDVQTLKYFRDYVNAGNTCEGRYFQLTADINLNNENWTPIGNAAADASLGFSGIFDGGGHTISGLGIASGSDYQGLFGYVSGATIRNFTVEGSIAVQGKNGVTKAIGDAWNGTIVDQCVNYGTITLGAATDCIGGIVGYTLGSCKITNSVNFGTVSSSASEAYIGGILGYVNNGDFSALENCYNTGAVSCAGNEQYSGAITGWARNINAAGRMKNNYYLEGSAGSAFGTGGSSGTAASKTAAEFSLGEVAYLLQSGQGSLIWGQAIGSDAYPVLTGDQSRQVYKVTFDYTAEDTGDVVRYANHGGSVSLPDGSGLDVSTGNITRWLTPEGGTFTSDTQVTEDITLTEQSGFFAQGSGMESDPYLIPDEATLECFRDYVNAGNGCEGRYFRLTADIDLSGGDWTPIGNAEVDDTLCFSGIFDGAGYTIGGLGIASGSDYQGLFGILEGTVWNLHVTGSVSGGTYVGGIAGYNRGTILNCINSSSVSGNAKAGGIAGGGSGTIANSTSIGKVGSTSGGIIGANEDGSIVSCCCLTGTAGTGIGSGSGSGEAAAKTEEQYKSGEAAHLLQGEQETLFWGQKLGEDTLPVLTGEEDKRVYKVSFQLDDGSEYMAAYTNPGGTVEPPESGFDLSTGYTTLWLLPDGEEFTVGTIVTGDTVVTAKIWFFAEGEGTEEFPYLIPDLQTLETFRDSVNEGNSYEGKYFQLTADIDMSEVYGEDKGPWTPIGDDKGRGMLYFSGIFDGADHIISSVDCIYTMILPVYMISAYLGC